MADEYPEVEMSDIEDPTDSSPPPSDYDPSSDSDDSINNLDPESVSYTHLTLPTIYSV